jgi:hypothetical protein
MRIRDLYASITEDASQTHLLFHGTSTPAAAHILHEGGMIGSADDGGPMGVSFATERRVADDFAHDVDERDASSAKDNTGMRVQLPAQGRGAILIFDRAIVARHAKIVPYQWDGVDEEREERVLGRRMGLQGLVRVEISRASFEAWTRFYASVEDEEYVSPLSVIVDHPLVKLI